jgi:CheY-like chemotaxis protein
MTAKTVLLVDDSRVARMMTRKLIEHGRPGWTVVEADNGTDGVTRFKELRPDFVLMDVNMPGIDGVEAARQIKEAAPDAVVSLLTANIQAPVRQRAEEIGVGFIAKPATEDALMAFLTAEVP